MVKLEDRGVCEPAVGADTGTQDTEDVRPRRCATDVPSSASLLSVEVASLANVLPATLFAARLTLMEIRGKQHPATAIAELRRLPYNPRCVLSGPHGLCDVPRPDAHRGECNPELSTDLPKRAAIGTQPSRLRPLSSLRTHTNIGSRMRCNRTHT